MNGINEKFLARAPFKKGALVLVLGAGSSGEAAARLAAALGARVRVLEKNSAAISREFTVEAQKLGIEIQTGEHNPDQFKGAALAIISPGIPPANIERFLKEAGAGPLMAELEFASLFTEAPIIAVTGTSGKTTTVSIMAAMLEKAGKKVFLGGNIGTPLSTYVLREEMQGRPADVLVLEVSSFQLMGCRDFHPQVAVLLNLGLNHLDWHRDMTEYSAAKFRLFKLQNKNELALINADLEQEAAQHDIRARQVFFEAHPSFGDPGKGGPGKGSGRRFPQSRLLGPHNRVNEEVAFKAVEYFGVSEEQAASAIAEFKPLPNRLEPVREKDGILYVNDTKSTTADSLAAALRSFSEVEPKRPVLLLAGGKFKGGDLEGLRGLLKDSVKRVGLFGDSREVFEKAWAGVVPIFWEPNLDLAFNRLREQAVSGDVILLSPATSSFDLYKDYKERGTHFRRLAEGV